MTTKVAVNNITDESTAKNADAAQLANKSILFLISHGMGEMDVVVPLAIALKQKGVYCEIVFTVRTLFAAYQQADFLPTILREKNIPCRLHFFPNKFDLQGAPAVWQNRYVAKAVRTFFRFYNLPFVLYQLAARDAIAHEASNQRTTTELFYFFNRFFGRKIFMYLHGHAIVHSSVVRQKTPDSHRAIYLALEKDSMPHFKERGFETQHLLGFPRFFEEWQATVAKYNRKSQQAQQLHDHVVVFTRHPHKYYMDEDKYQKIIRSICRVVSETLPETKLVFKRHPRESEEHLHELMADIGNKNIIITKENAAVLLQNAKFSVSMFTSVVLDSIAMGVPTVEYYIEADRFREVELAGSCYRNVGIDSVDNEQDFRAFVERLKQGQYVFPALTKEYQTTRNINIF